MFSLTQQSMTKKRIQFEDRLLQRATLFPMFTSMGKVEALLVVDHYEGKLYGLQQSKGLVFKPWFRPIRIARKLANLEELSVEKSYQLTRYWHFDPWWLLNEAPFDRQLTTPALKSTNSVNEMEKALSIYFARDLSKVDFWSRPNGEALSFISLRDEPLPPREEAEPPREVLRKREDLRKGGWRLRPFWQRAG